MKSAPTSRITAVDPLWAVEGGRVTIGGSDFSLEPQPPEVRLRRGRAPVAHASRQSLTVIVPAGLDGGRTPVRVDSAPGETAYVEIGAPMATGVHQVDNPAFDHEGNLYVTFSGSRGQDSAGLDLRRAPRRLARTVRRAGCRIRPRWPSIRGAGCTCRAASTAASTASPRRSVTTVATDLGVACGIAFNPDGRALRRRSIGIDAASERGARDGLRDDSVERRGVPSRLRSRRLALRDGPDARRRGTRSIACRQKASSRRSATASAVRRGWRSTAKASSTSSMRWRGRAPCTASSDRPGSGSACCRAERCSAWRSIRSAGSSCRRARRCTGSMSGCAASCRVAAAASPASRVIPRHDDAISGATRNRHAISAIASSSMLQLFKRKPISELLPEGEHGLRACSARAIWSCSRSAR